MGRMKPNLKKNQTYKKEGMTANAGTFLISPAYN